MKVSWFPRSGACHTGAHHNCKSTVCECPCHRAASVNAKHLDGSRS